MWAATFEIFALGVRLLASPIVPDKLENISVFLTSSQALNADIAFLSASCTTAFSFFWEIDLKHEDVFLQYALLIIMWSAMRISQEYSQFYTSQLPICTCSCQPAPFGQLLPLFC